MQTNRRPKPGDTWKHKIYGQLLVIETVDGDSIRLRNVRTSETQRMLVDELWHAFEFYAAS